ncbi:hypothetical protein BGZ95_000878 [Linnemannia exigua]|uniref:Transmembrane protein n=1 Tax=Linnemannia exigua TaxID=604196 RepID=A0AAD4D9S2_9FUNG|nr:hypothetical protein BGZ95_000878 [Linnemannia exigua]
MGLIDLDCIATSPDGTSLYGIGNAQNEEGGTTTLIYKSIENPTDVSSMTWFKIGEDRYSPRFFRSDSAYDPWYKYSRFGNVDCAVSSSGDFTAFFHNSEFAALGNARPVPMGIQVKEKFGVRRVSGFSMYGWTNHPLHQSFYIEKDGVETAVHAVMDQAASVIRFGVVDPKENLLKLAAVWKLADGKFMVGDLTDHIPMKGRPELNSGDDLTPPDKRHMVFSNNTLYLYSDATGIISSFPFPSPHTFLTQRDTIQASPAPTDKSTVSKFFRGTRQGASYLGWLSRTYNSAIDADSTTRTFTVKSTTLDLSQVPIPAKITLSANNTITRSTTMRDGTSAFGNMNFLYGMGGQLQGQQPFVVSLNVDGYAGITIGGPSTGNITSPQNSTLVTEGIQDSDYRSPFRNYHDQVMPDTEIPRGSMPPMSIFGIAVGVFFLLLLSLYPMSRINTWLEVIRQYNEKEANAARKESSHELSNLSRNDGEPPGYNNDDPGTGGSSRSGARNGPRGGGGGGGEERVPFMASSSGNSTVHSFMEGLGLSRHPRPTVSTTAADNDNHDFDEETRRFQVVTHTQ